MIEPTAARLGHHPFTPGSVYQELRDCERGAVMIAGIFMTLFLVAMLYAVIGIGRTLVMREGMQDAADAAAFSAAIFHARGMNLIVFINLIMAMLVAILIAIRLAQSLLIMIAFAATAGAFFSGGSTLALAAPATQGAVALEKAFKAAKKVVFPLLAGLHKTQEAISVVVPWVAMADGMVEAASHHPAAKGAFALPGATSLPIEADKFSVLCKKASEKAAELATKTAFGGPFLPFEAPSFILGPIKGAAGALGESTSSFLCGDGKGSPPKHTQTASSQYPKPDGLEACESYPKSQKCTEVERELLQSTPNEYTGRCQQHCSYNGPYETQARKARRECKPGAGRHFTKFTWQRRTVDAEFIFEGGEWRETQRTVSNHRLFTNSVPPCGTRVASLSKDWDLDSGPKTADEPEALCSNLEPMFSPTAPSSAPTRKRFFEIARIFSCSEEVEHEISLAKKDEALSGEKSKKRAPHKVEQDLVLGGEAFQIRAIAFGESPGPGVGRKGVRLVDWKKSPDTSKNQESEAPDDPGDEEIMELAARLGGLSIAQAEYYYKERSPRSEWMWNMFWTARLKHVRLPSKDNLKKEKARSKKNAAINRRKRGEHSTPKAAKSNQAACKKSKKKDCTNIDSAFNLFDGIVRH